MPPPPPTPPNPPVGDLVNIIGYWGNSGAAKGRLPRIAELHPNYNVVILTFANLADSGEMVFEVQADKACCAAGAAYQSMDDLKTELAAWKIAPDPWGRRRTVLISIGGQNGHWPADSACGQACVLSALRSFFDEYHCDGLDVDLEGSHVASASSLVPVIQTLRASGKIVSAAPEAAQGPLEAYAAILPLLDYLTPQFYNNPPNAVTTPFQPTDRTRWPAPWTVSNWQTMSGGLTGEAYWYAVLKQTCALHGLDSPGAMGMLIPATPSAAGNNNLWDIPLLKAQMQVAGIKHVGTWAFAYDWENNWAFATAMGQLNGAGAPSPPSPPTPASPPPPLDIPSAPCLDWCEADSEAWDAKCQWAGSCAGCAPCVSPPPPPPSPPPSPNPTFGELPSPPSPSPPPPSSPPPPRPKDGEPCEVDAETEMCGNCPCGNCVANAIYAADPGWGYEDYCAMPERGCRGLFCDCTCGVHAATVTTSLNTQNKASDDDVSTGVVIAVSVLAIFVFVGGLFFGAVVARLYLAKTAEQKPLMNNVQMPAFANRSNRPGLASTDKTADPEAVSGVI